MVEVVPSPTGRRWRAAPDEGMPLNHEKLSLIRPLGTFSRGEKEDCSSPEAPLLPASLLTFDGWAPVITRCPVTACPHWLRQMTCARSWRMIPT